VIVLVLMLAIAVLSLTPDRPQPGDTVFEWLVHVTPTLTQKLLHVAIYGLFAVSLWWFLERIDRASARLLTAFAIAAGFGAAMEALQVFVPGRFGSIVDVALNAVGAVIGLGVNVAFVNAAGTDS
jgi:VanZ family protein